MCAGGAVGHGSKDAKLILPGDSMVCVQGDHVLVQQRERYRQDGRDDL